MEEKRERGKKREQEVRKGGKVKRMLLYENSPCTL